MTFPFALRVSKNGRNAAEAFSRRDHNGARTQVQFNAGFMYFPYLITRKNTRTMLAVKTKVFPLYSSLLVFHPFPNIDHGKGRSKVRSRVAKICAPLALGWAGARRKNDQEFPYRVSVGHVISLELHDHITK